MNWSSDAARNRELWTTSNAEYTDASARDALGGRRDHLGCLERPRGRRSHPAGASRARTWSSSAAAPRTVSAWLARRGARPVGVDITPAQLDTARAMQKEFGLEFPLIEADAAETRPPGRDPRISSSPSTARRSGSIPTAGSLRRRGCSARRRARLPAQLHARDPLLARRGSGRGEPAARRSSGCTGSSGRKAASSSISGTAT